MLSGGSNDNEDGRLPVRVPTVHHRRCTSSPEGHEGEAQSKPVAGEVGKRYGNKLLRKIPNRILKQEHLDRAEESVRRNGGKAVFIGHFTAALRVLVPGFSGMSQVRPTLRSGRRRL